MRRDSDGIYTRKNREGFWMHWQDGQGKRESLDSIIGIPRYRSVTEPLMITDGSGASD
jgi:hypothetical protein